MCMYDVNDSQKPFNINLLLNGIEAWNVGLGSVQGELAIWESHKGDAFKVSYERRTPGIGWGDIGGQENSKRSYH